MTRGVLSRCVKIADHPFSFHVCRPRHGVRSTRRRKPELAFPAQDARSQSTAGAKHVLQRLPSALRHAISPLEPRARLFEELDFLGRARPSQRSVAMGEAPEALHDLPVPPRVIRGVLRFLERAQRLEQPQ